MNKVSLPSMPSFRLDGKRALVTGAGRGIGLAAAAALAEAGAAVTLASRSSGEIEQAGAALRARGQQAEAWPVDVTDIQAVAAGIAEREPYDVFFNNAGTNRPNPFVEVPVEDFDFVMNLNVRAAYFCAQAVARRLLAAGKAGSIINMSSQLGLVGAPNRSLYCASKWAMEGFSRAMAVELAPHQIRVNTLCPTFIETPMTRPFFQNAAFKESVIGKIKLGRIGTVEDLMGAIVFLAGDAAALMTGSSLVVDGGWTAD
jgi:NAD(P)-dependent dehydrogenase (short-subunit alcohol dehydrogenase family)